MFEKLKALILQYVEVAPDEITENARFVDDLGFNSYDFMSLLGQIEDELNVEVEEREAVKLKTVGDAVAYLVSLTK